MRADAGFAARVGPQVTSLQAQLGLVAAGLGWAFVSRSVIESLHVTVVLREAVRQGRRTFPEQALENAERIGRGQPPFHEAGCGFGGGWAVPVEIGVTVGVNMAFEGFGVAPTTMAPRAPVRVCERPSQHPGLDLIGSAGDASTRRGRTGRHR